MKDYLKFIDFDIDPNKSIDFRVFGKHHHHYKDPFFYIGAVNLISKEVFGLRIGCRFYHTNLKNILENNEGVDINRMLFSFNDKDKVTLEGVDVIDTISILGLDKDVVDKVSKRLSYLTEECQYWTGMSCRIPGR